MVRRKKYGHKRVPVHSSVTREVKLTLEMLGFSVPALIEEILINIAGSRKCPTCERELKPRIISKYKKGKVLDEETLRLFD